jgi:hypothetical protein
LIAKGILQNLSGQHCLINNFRLCHALPTTKTTNFLEQIVKHNADTKACLAKVVIN